VSRTAGLAALAGNHDPEQTLLLPLPPALQLCRARSQQLAAQFGGCSYFKESFAHKWT